MIAAKMPPSTLGHDTSVIIQHESLPWCGRTLCEERVWASLDCPANLCRTSHNVRLSITEILMRELANLEVDEHVRSQQPVIEDKIDEEVLFVKGEPLLPGLKEEALPQFKQEL